MLLVPLVAGAVALPVHAQTGRGTKPPATAKPAQPTTAKPQTTKPQQPTTVPPAQAPVPAPAAVPAAPPPAAEPPAAIAPLGANPSLLPPPPAVTPSVTMAPDYVIGAGDVLAVVFWRQQDMSTEVVVRPDGRISVPLLNEIDASGLTPEQLRQTITTEAQRFVQDPNVTVVVKQINSRRVYITGQVARPGPYPLTSSMNVLQLISMAGGLTEYADEKNILVMRTAKSGTTHFTFNYKDMINRKNLKQNIDLKPDDTVIVP
jgi:polysaccharide export outer membrane protein